MIGTWKSRQNISALPSIGKELVVKLSLMGCVWLAAITHRIVLAQPGPPAENSPQFAQPAPVEDFKPATTNQAGRQYPQVNSERRVRARIVAPEAHSVFLDISGVRYPMTRDEEGAWIGDSMPQDEGNHYYQLVIDGAQVPDPGSTFIFGSGAWRNDIEIPANDQEFYALKSVPHGQVREVFYVGNTSNSIRHSFIYTPPDYDKDLNRRFPVLYLQHGYSEGESGWSAQGHAGLIMDNLIAEGKAKPFIIVMENGGIAASPGDRARDPRGVNFGAFEEVIVNDVIPYVDANFRTLADQSHRALAGLSMGGMQTRQISLAQPELFAYVGIFSGGTISSKDIADNDAFRQNVKLVFMSYGSREKGSTTVQYAADQLTADGVKAVSYVSPATAHEWQTWRRSLHEFAPLLFQE
jgi:enterochelin esterase-like enzyme